MFPSPLFSDNVDAIIFIAAISEYDQTLAEDTRVVSIFCFITAAAKPCEIPESHDGDYVSLQADGQQQDFRNRCLYDSVS